MGKVVEAERVLSTMTQFFESPDWHSEHPTQCLPAVVKMTLTYFFPDQTYDWNQISELIHQVPGKWAVTTGTVLSLNELGLVAKQITDFDYADFAVRGMGYIRDRYKLRPKSAAAFEANVEVTHEQKIAMMALRLNPNAFENRVPTIDDLVKGVRAQNTLVVVQFNAASLINSPQYVGHFGLVTGINLEDNVLCFHDPGGSTHPPEPNRSVPLDIFFRSWAGEQGVDGTLIEVSNPDA